MAKVLGKRTRTGRTPRKTKAEKKASAFTRPRLHRWVVAVAVYVLVLAATLILPARGYRPSLDVGSVAPRSMFAASSFTVEDRAATSSDRDDARAAVRPVYRVDPAVLEEGLSRCSQVFEELARVKAGQLSVEELALEVPDAAIEAVIRKDELDLVESETVKAVKLVLSGPLVGDLDKLESEAGKTVILNRDGAKSETAISSLASMGSLKQYLAKELRGSLGRNRQARSAVLEITMGIARPNLLVDEEETQAAREIAAAAVPTSMRAVEEGEAIVRRGDRVSEEHLYILAAMAREDQPERGGVMLRFGGMALLVLVCVIAMGMYLWRFHSPDLTGLRYLAILGLAGIGTTVFARVATVIPLPGDTVYAVPVAGVTMAVAVLLQPRVGIMLSLLLGLLVGEVSGHNLEAMVVATVGGIAGVYGALGIRHRLHILKAALLVACANVLTITALELLRAVPAGEISITSLGGDLMWGAVNAGLSGIVAAVSVPVLEHVFNLVTDSKLLELADLNQPVLKRLEQEAPGTYQSSLVVGALAEASARAIGANGLLARVGAYYHDIGKVTKPSYFGENESTGNGKSDHDRISPRMSNLVLLSHVKSGVELGAKYRLPGRILDLIQQHHGTTMTAYFYDRARETEVEGEEVRDSDFRYPGPKPQTKEAALLLLSDSVEAAVRSLEQPGPKQIRDTVDQVIKTKVDDRQLDECDLNLRDLSLVSESFTRTLVSHYHRRVKYPEVKT